MGKCNYSLTHKLHLGIPVKGAPLRTYAHYTSRAHVLKRTDAESNAARDIFLVKKQDYTSEKKHRIG
jgi:hypothetical protein